MTKWLQGKFVLSFCNLFVYWFLCASSISYGQSEWENLDPSWLQEVMPSATTFLDKQGNPPLVLAYNSYSTNAEPELVGYVFTTPDLPPEELGFSGPIDMLVGMNLQGEITGVKVLHYLESYKHVRGDFIGDANFVDQFVGKSLEDDFRVNRDIDGMARATITSWAMSRGLRNAARRVAEAYLPGSSYTVEATEESAALQTLQSQSWEDYIANGFVREFSAAIDGESDLQFAVAYMGHYRLGELLIGDADYSNADRAASAMIEDGHMLLVALDGNTPRLQQLRLGAMQNGILYPNQEDRVVFAGTARNGKITGQAQLAVALFLDAEVDITQPFTVLYDTGDRRGEYSETIGVEYAVSADILSLVMGQPLEEESNVTQNMYFFAVLLLALILLALNWPRIKAATIRE
jgi:NosR/NirI family transcriptional regulator, nitrous oxide reductase regulator